MSRSRKQRDKSMSVFTAKTADGTRMITSTNIGNDFTNGHRGMAHAVRGAKKYVRTRVRFAGKQSLRNKEWDWGPDVPEKRPPRPESKG